MQLGAFLPRITTSALRRPKVRLCARDLKRDKLLGEFTTFIYRTNKNSLVDLNAITLEGIIRENSFFPLGITRGNKELPYSPWYYIRCRRSLRMRDRKLWYGTCARRYGAARGTTTDWQFDYCR